ncbi:S9 family peptidase [Nocardia pseudobrasiliensis]|uniref:Dipeptidyl aminopeptidase/acylaminoacyl peptidase n=1 Tax=Nocardia pseudobrasiliensis TaxID=45979 RepID=A0A370HXY4_9NOCA|nr:S9 family peptidase [Nocardia pseudobrasiliensis]RDI63363.1 dipeptidyl aminopeptidase/acylaminoacyl peptidase [Nocardia pseudobrasiliensis]
MPLPEPLTVEDLFDSPTRAGATISPDGTRYAFLAPWRNRLNVWVQDLDSQTSPRCVTADENRSVFRYRWSNDARWLLYQQDGDGDENWHLFRVDPADPDAGAVDLTPFPGARVLAYELPRGRADIAIVQLNQRDVLEFDVYELDLVTGELTILARNPGRVAGWLSGDEGELFATVMTAEGDLELCRWEAGTLRTVTTFDGIDYPLGVFPMLPTPDGSGIWLGSNRGTDRTRLVRLDVTTGVEVEIDSHPTFDLDTRGIASDGQLTPLIRDPRTGELIGVRYLGERQVIHALDPGFAAVLERLSALSDGDIDELTCDDSGQRWVVNFAHDRDPHVTYYYNHATGEHRLLFRPYPHLNPRSLAPMTPVSITARDGLCLPSYLTLPVGIEPDRLPLVLLVHGGPWARDSWGYEPTAQLLANRGYAVLQINFRGSTGFGKAFVQAAIGEFAGRMHDDLLDGVRWAVARGYADPDRVAVFGGSYGGYAALVGASFTPDVFAAAVDYCGISNLANFLRTVPAFVRPYLINNWFRYVGDPSDPDQEADMLARSPITRADRIRIPLMVVQGATDVRVVQAESDNLVEALRARGVQVEYLLAPNEGHGFVNPENVIGMYRAVDRFLAEHLGGRA